MELADVFPEVATFLIKSQYIDDLAKSLKSKDEAERLAWETEKVLGKIDMSVKGWAMSGKDPPPELTKDGVSVGMCLVS